MAPPVVHSGAVAPAFIVRTSVAEPFANFANVVEPVAYKTSPAAKLDNPVPPLATDIPSVTVNV